MTFLFQEQRWNKSVNLKLHLWVKFLFGVKLKFWLLHSWWGAFHTVLFVSLVACSYGDYWQMNNLGHLTGGRRWASVHVTDWRLVPWPYSGQGWIPRHGGCHWEEGQSLIPKLKPHFLNNSQFSVVVCVCVGHAFDYVCAGFLQSLRIWESLGKLSCLFSGPEGWGFALVFCQGLKKFGNFMIMVYRSSAEG